MTGITDSDFFRSILENLQLAVYVVSCDGKILFWNDGAERQSPPSSAKASRFHRFLFATKPGHRIPVQLWAFPIQLGKLPHKIALEGHTDSKQYPDGST